MRLSLLNLFGLRLISAGIMAMVTGTAVADGSSGWDEFPESIRDKTLYSNGIAAWAAHTFYFDPPTVFAIDNPWRFFEENPDMQEFHSPPNVFQTSGYVSDGGWLLTRVATMSLTTGQVETDARVNLFWKEAGDEFIGTEIILEASRMGEVVAEDRMMITENRRTVFHREFVVGGVEFDTLKVRCEREFIPQLAGALLAIDNLEITGGGPRSELELEAPVPARINQENTLIARWHTPGDRIFFAWGIGVGAVEVPGCPGLMADLKRPQVLGSARVDANGEANFTFFAPAAALDRSIYFQAFELNSCTKSPFAPVTFEE